MADTSASSPGNPYEVLTGLGDLTRKVRVAQRGTWFPLLLFAVLTLSAILIDRFTFTARTLPCPVGHNGLGAGTSCVSTRQGMPGYWAVGLVLAYTATAFFYIRRSRNRGVGTPIRPYVLTGIAIAVLFGATAFLAAPHPATPAATIDFWGLPMNPSAGPTMLLERFTGTAASIGVPLLVLSWVERNRALLVFALAYLVLELVPISTGAWTAPGSPWSALPHLAITAVFLLLGALGFALAQQPQRTAS